MTRGVNFRSATNERGRSKEKQSDEREMNDAEQFAAGGRSPALHWLAEGVWTLQAEGRPSARSRSMVMPPTEEEAPPPITEQRHCGLDWTTDLSCEQHEALGDDEPFPLM
jgi:hypothetical protein